MMNMYEEIFVDALYDLYTKLRREVTFELRSDDTLLITEEDYNKLYIAMKKIEEID